MRYTLLLLCLLAQQSQPPVSTEAASGAPRKSKEANRSKLSQWTETAFANAVYTDALLEALIRERGGNPEKFRVKLFDLVIRIANAIGNEAEPRAALTRAVKEFTGPQGLHLPEGNRAEPGFAEVLPDKVLEEKCGTEVVLTAIFLSITERQIFGDMANPHVPLKPYIIPGSLALRYRFNGYRLNVLLSGDPVILSDRELNRRYPLKDRARKEGVYFRTISRPELGGLLLTELAKAHRTEGELGRAEFLFTRAVKLFQNSPPPRELPLCLARVLIRNGHYSKASEHLTSVIRRSPEHGEARFLRGIARFKNGNNADAKTDLHKACENGYTEGETAWLFLARMAQKEGSMENLRRYLITFKEKAGRKDLTAEIQEALNRLKVKDAVSALKALDYEDRFEAVDTIKKHPTDGGIEALIKSLKDPNHRFREYVWQSLCKIAGKALPYDQSAWWDWLAERRKNRKKKNQLWRLLEEAPSEHRKELTGLPPP